VIAAHMARTRSPNAAFASPKLQPSDMVHLVQSILGKKKGDKPQSNISKALADFEAEFTKE